MNGNYRGNSTISNMSRSSTDKSFSNVTVSPVTLSSQATKSRPAEFIPKYEEALNNNLRIFGDPEAQRCNVQPFDRIQEPSVDRGFSKKQRYVLMGGFAGLLVVAMALMGGLLAAKFTSEKHQVSTPANATQTITSTFVAESASQTPLSTRSTATSTMITVTATETQTQTTSVVLVSPALRPTESVNALPPVISATTFITTTVAGASSELFTSYITVTGKPQTFFSYSPATTSTTTSVPSSVIEASKSAAASISSVLKSLQAHATPLPITSSHTHVVPSLYHPSAPPPVTTSTPAPPPPPPAPSPETTPAPTSKSKQPIVPSLTSADKPLPSGGWINYCGVPGSSCDE